VHDESNNSKKNMDERSKVLPIITNYGTWNAKKGENILTP
jgi:hypothetical protein